MKILSLILCLLLCICLITPAVYARRDETAITPAPQPPLAGDRLTFKGSPCDPTGKWQTNWGKMKLTQAGGKVTGEYSHDSGKIEGTISRNSFSGRWSESPTYQEPKDAGLVELTFAPDCNSFTGRWRYGANGNWYENNWTGERINAQQKLPQ
ncbi:MAG: hypothetical protein PHH69_02140 [Candidatus Omnitrophica bacterium]|nr:hypothetical protein [Candidatus Omnitrophota bacterium]MDD5610330.1 hypothetical protein [Candidatus Omnitrophota bacterium]